MILNMYEVEVYEHVFSDVDPNKHVFSVYLLNHLLFFHS